MGISESRNDCWFSGGGRFNFVHTLDIDKSAVDAVATAEEGVYTMSGVDFVRCNNVLAERLNGSPIRECSGCSECLHRGGRPAFLV